jgi:8-hydroxy-5-deazaflavin:NADPH oxidoreductase
MPLGQCVEKASRKEPSMKVAVVGKGNVGGGLADLWERAGHHIVARIGEEGGDVSDADVVLVAVPGGAIANALDNVQGISGKTVIDATNLVGAEPPEGFASNAEFVKSKTNGPTAKSFNLNFASQYGKLSGAKSRPCNLWSGDDEARPVVEQLNRDAGYEPVHLGGLDKAATQEHGTDIVFAVAQHMGPFFYRFAPPERL